MNISIRRQEQKKRYCGLQLQTGGSGALLYALPNNLTPNEAYNQVANILNTVRNAIINNPNTHLNDLIF